MFSLFPEPNFTWNSDILKISQMRIKLIPYLTVQITKLRRKAALQHKKKPTKFAVNTIKFTFISQMRNK